MKAKRQVYIVTESAPETIILGVYSSFEKAKKALVNIPNKNNPYIEQKDLE